MTDLTPFASSLAAILAALARARYQLVHASPDQLPAPYYLVEGDINFPALTRTTGTVVVTGALTVTGPPRPAPGRTAHRQPDRRRDLLARAGVRRCLPVCRRRPQGRHAHRRQQLERRRVRGGRSDRPHPGHQGCRRRHRRQPARRAGGRLRGRGGRAARAARPVRGWPPGAARPVHRPARLERRPRREAREGEQPKGQAHHGQGQGEQGQAQGEQGQGQTHQDQGQAQRPRPSPPRPRPRSPRPRPPRPPRPSHQDQDHQGQGHQDQGKATSPRPRSGGAERAGRNSAGAGVSSQPCSTAWPPSP
jgi:hypothetical protein